MENKIRVILTFLFDYTVEMAVHTSKDKGRWEGAKDEIINIHENCTRHIFNTMQSSAKIYICVIYSFVCLQALQVPIPNPQRHPKDYEIKTIETKLFVSCASN